VTFLSIFVICNSAETLNKKDENSNSEHMGQLSSLLGDTDQDMDKRKWSSLHVSKFLCLLNFMLVFLKKKKISLLEKGNIDH
jgi:hypothetical protein